MSTVEVESGPNRAHADPGRHPHSRREQADATRELLLRTAERLFAERGLAEVSNRQIVDAAGQANNSALTYHVGTRADLLRAISDSHSEPIARRTRDMLDAARESAEPRDYVACIVQPYTEHLASLGTPSWCARLTAQLATDPTFGGGMLHNPEMASLLEQAHAAMRAFGPVLSPDRAKLRYQAARLAVVHTCAEQEHSAADTESPADWDLIGDALTDSLAGLLLAPAHQKPGR